MSSLRVEQVLKPLKREISLLGDKSIAHRAVILSSLSNGKTIIQNFPTNKDCLYTIKVFKKLGVKIKNEQTKGHTFVVSGKGLFGLSKPRGSLFVGESGTTLRLILGVLSGQNFQATLNTAKSLSRRPMLRVTAPLRMMGALIKSKKNKSEEYPPIVIKGGNLKPIAYRMSVASAQVKSAILLAALYSDGLTRIIEPLQTRDHTERMLKLFKADIKLSKKTIIIKGGRELLSPKKIYVPGDISSASFFIVLSLILPDAEILIKNVSLNPTRSGIIRVLKRMGADIQVTIHKSGYAGLEPIGNIRARSSRLKGTVIRKEEIPSLIDELPVLMVAACVSDGKTVFTGVQELRIKETDRIRSMSENLIKMGAKVEVAGTESSEDIIIEGVKGLNGSRVRSFGDHRTAMSMVVAGLKAEGATIIDDISCINKSFPEFPHLLKKFI